MLLLLSSELFSWRGFFTFHLAHLRLGGRVDALWVQGDQIFAILLVNLGVLVLLPGIVTALPWSKPSSRITISACRGSAA